MDIQQIQINNHGLQAVDQNKQSFFGASAPDLSILMAN
jgi:hypothetical protein